LQTAIFVIFAMVQVRSHFSSTKSSDMLKEHPRGLIVAFFTNMGERFGFYTMMAILVLFLQAKYGLTESQAGEYYSWFYFGIYALALVGGILADATRKYKFVILMGILIMFAGYIIMSFPGNPLGVTITGLFTIALGNGLFKGNLQAVVGQMYDNPKYSKVRDSAFMIFYMGINIGAFFAPFVATGIRNWFLKTQGFLHDGSLPAMCHAHLKGTLEDPVTFQNLADKVSGTAVTDLGIIAHQYLDAFSKGYNYAFGIAAGAMIISLLVYIIFNKYLPAKEKAQVVRTETGTVQLRSNLIAIVVAATLMAIVTLLFHFLWDHLALGLAIGLFLGFVALIVQISTKEERPRILSLIMVFAVVVFFWMSFHQNGLTLTFFARDYTVKEVSPFTNIFFNLESILAFIGAVAGLILIFNKKSINRIIGGIMFLGLGALTWYFISKGEARNPIAPEVFQSFNPLFIVSLTFPVMAVFAWLRKKEREPSTPKKIGIGMIIAAVGFVVILVASLHLISPHELQYTNAAGDVKYNPVPDSSRVVPYWLISSYLILTVAELFLSPMGLSFVSKVAPSRFQGLMQGGWLLATAVGNKLLFIGSNFWGKLDLWQLWAIFIVCCLLSAVFIFSIMRRLEKATR
jgi:POT family proton-dependent oligopeptide transporter